MTYLTKKRKPAKVKARKKPMIVANWKMNPETSAQAKKLFVAINNAASSRADIVVCPSFVHLEAVSSVAERISLGAQDVYWERAGAYTGEVSPTMLKSLGITHVIIGHSERRELGETNAIVQAKVKAALEAGLRVILCVGEKQRGDSGYVAMVKEEVREALRRTPQKFSQRVTIAYEPIWAVGARKADTPESTLEMVIYIRKVFFDLYGSKAASGLRVLYGGSVTSKNARAFLNNGGVDGVLVGRASLDPEEFKKIVDECI